MAIEVPKEVLIWKFDGKAGNLKSQNTYPNNSGYNLFCDANNEYLTWEKTMIGINLGFTKDSKQRKVHFRLPDKSQREILTGEKVALGIGGNPSFLKYAERTMGINLEWSVKPVFEWRIYGKSAKAGEKIPTGSFFAIVNEKVEPKLDFLVFLDRVPGQADIGWTTSPNWPGKILKAWNSVEEIREKLPFL